VTAILSHGNVPILPVLHGRPARAPPCRRDAESHGSSIIGVFHSHTHTEPYPSPTDVSQAPDPSWHYVLVSLRDTHPVVGAIGSRSRIMEESVVLKPHELTPS